MEYMTEPKCNLLFIYLQKSQHVAGASRMVYSLLTSLSERYNISVLLIDESGLHRYLKDCNKLRIYTLQARSYRHLLIKLPQLFRLVSKIIHTEKIKAIWLPNLKHFILFAWLRLKPVCLISNHYRTHSNIFIKLLYTFTHMFSDVVIHEYSYQPQSMYLLKKLIHSPKNRVIYTGHDFSSFPPPRLCVRNKGSLKLGMVAAITRVKGILEVINAVGDLCDLGFDVHLTIVGDIPSKRHLRYLQKIKRTIIARELTGNVYITGWIEHERVLRLLSQLHVFVSMSYAEGLSGALREAAALGIPIVATDVGGAREIVKDGYNGILIPPGDKKALIKAILQINNNYDHFATNSLKHAETIRRKFTMIGFITGYKKLLDEICNKCNHSADFDSKI